MQCCGEERTTNYCPECGTRVRQLNDLERLTLHLVACYSRAITKNQQDASLKWNAFIESLMPCLPTPIAPEIKTALTLRVPKPGTMPEPDDA
ncbi:MAG TPA: hypothetical protein VMW24_09515 [Sedimentisphaerales bacterium]|nr:hypothetical protein [Sedimentisphaerales bacterium]